MNLSILSLGLLSLLACVAEAPKPEPAAAPVPAPAPEVIKPVPPPTPPPVAVAPAVPAAPVPPAAPAKKKGGIPLGLPSLKILKDDVGFDGKQVKQVRELYATYQARLEEAAEQVKSGTDKKTAKKSAEALRTEVLAKAREICTDAQKAKFDEVSVPKKKAKP